MDRHEDIILLSPPSRMVNHYRPPLSLMYAAEWYRQQGKEVKIIDIPMRQVVRNREFWKNKDKMINAIKDEMIFEALESPAETIGISCYSPEFEEVKEMIGRLKDKKIIVGGIHPTLYPTDFDGIAEVFRGKCNVKFPAYDLVDMGYYTNANPYAIRGVYLRATYVLSSMGCPSQCTFCVAPRLIPHYGVGSIKEPTELAFEIKWLKEKYNIDGFYIIDDCFTLKKEYVKEFCRAVKPLNLLWGCSSRINTIDAQVIVCMAKSGCIQMDFGVERGSNEELRRLRKGQTVEQIKDVFKICRKNNVRTFANFLVGVPQEEERDRQDIERLVKTIRPSISSFNLFEPYCGTELRGEIQYRLLPWIKERTRRYNSIWRNIGCYFRWQYWKNIFSNKQKKNYLDQLWNLIQELINQKL